MSRLFTVLVSSVLIALGLGLILRTAQLGTGGGVGYLLGSLFVLAGAARIFLATRTG